MTLGYSGNDLDLHSASEDEEDADVEVDDELSDVGPDNDNDVEEPTVSRTLTFISKEATPDTGGVTAVADDSETESESELEPVGQTLKRKSPSFPQVMPASKRKQTPLVEGMSWTLKVYHLLSQFAVDDSETESGSEEDPLVKTACSTGA